VRPYKELANNKGFSTVMKNLGDGVLAGPTSDCLLIVHRYTRTIILLSVRIHRYTMSKQSG